MVRTPWWRGARGEWFVVAQGALILLILFGPRNPEGWPAFPVPFASRVLGSTLMAAGGALALAAMVGLGRRNLTPLPAPREGAELVESGPYALARHPIYGGVILLAFGWGLWVRGWLTLGYALLGWLFLEWKSRREERWLMERYPGYGEYRKRVRRFIPFLY